MSIRQQKIDENGIYILFSNGYELDLDKKKIRQLVIQEGSKQAALQAIKTMLQQNVGSLLDVRDILVDFRASDGLPNNLEWGSR